MIFIHTLLIVVPSPYQLSTRLQVRCIDLTSHELYLIKDRISQVPVLAYSFLMVINIITHSINAFKTNGDGNYEPPTLHSAAGS